MKSTFLSSLVALVLYAAARAQGNVFEADPNIYEVSTSSFDRVVHQSNYTSLVVFYAPWCGYCQQLKPTLQKVAKRLHEKGQYAARVVTVNCDEDKNKPLCGEHRVQGFPTLMVFRPPKYSEGSAPKSKARHASEVYSGDRSTKAIVANLLGRIKNYVKRFPAWNDALGEWIGKDSDRIVLVSSLSQLSPLLKTLAIDFLGSVKFALAVVKNDKDAGKITVNGQQVALPEAKLPLLAYYKSLGDAGEFVTYAGPTKDKAKISKWIMEVTGKTPAEGPLSKREQKIAKYRVGKKKAPKKDEL